MFSAKIASWVGPPAVAVVGLGKTLDGELGHA
jgi:hypothetical protein